jgi:hypothetical protein
VLTPDATRIEDARSVSHKQKQEQPHDGGCPRSNARTPIADALD